MSEFSERLEREIKNIKKPLRYLAEASGLQLDYISKMSRGKRLPQDEERIIRLLDAMECMPGTRRELLQLYRQEKMGKTQWACIKELIGIIEWETPCHPVKTEAVPSLYEEAAAVTALEGKSEVYHFLKELLLGCREEQYLIWTAGINPGEGSEELFRLFHEMPGKRIEYIFPMRQNRDEIDTLENLKLIRLLKSMLFHDNFFPYYYYLVSMGEEQISPFPNWFITDGIAFGVNDSMQRGIVLKDKKQICILRDVFRKKLGMCKPLVVHSELTEYVHDVNSMMNAGYVIRNYYIEQSPCLLHLIPTNILKDQLIGEEEEKIKLLEVFQQRISHMKYEEMVHIFSMEGVRILIEEGRITGYPDSLYNPLPIHLRKWLLKRYYQYMRTSPNSCICVKDDCIKLPRYLSIVSSSNVDNGIAFWSSSENGLKYYVIKESGISQKLYEFCQYLESGEMTYSTEETLNMMERICF